MLCAVALCSAPVFVALMIVTPVLAQETRADGVRAEIDRDRIAANETLILQLFGDGRLSGEPEASKPWRRISTS